MKRLQRSSGRARVPGKSTVIRAVIGLWLVLGVVVGLAVLFAPDKPPAPPPSEIAYERPPSRTQSEDDGFIEPAWHGDEPDIVPASASDDAAPAEAFVIFGVVTDEDTGEPVSRAQVRVRREWTQEEQALWKLAEAKVVESRKSEDLEALQELRDEQVQYEHTHTDSEGRYAVRVGLNGQYWASAFHQGYVPLEAQAHLLEDGQTKLRIDLVLSRGASISGRVIESSSRGGAEGIEVYVQTREYGQHPVQTDRNGDYTIQGLLPGEYEVMLNLRDAPYELTGGIPTRNVTVHARSERVTGIDFVVEAAGIVWGYVLGDQREAVRGSEVLLCSGESIINQALSAVVKQAPPVHDKSRQDGYYELIGVPLNEEWRVYALSDDWAPQLSNPFILTDRARSVRVDLYVLSGTDVYGRVVSSEGGAVPMADTFCLPSLTKFFKPLDMPPAFREVRTDAEGAFVIRDLPAGDYQVLAQKEGFKFAARGRPIHPDGYSDIHNIEVVLIPVETGDYAIYGMVMDPWDNPIEGASVALMGGSTASMTAEGRETKTDAQGTYVFVGVDAGFYMLTCYAEGYAHKTVSNVRLQEPTDIVLEPTATLRGRVLIRETRRPPESYSVRAIPNLEEGGSIQGLIQQVEGIAGRHFSDEEGVFELSVPAGVYTLEARAPGHTAGRETVEVETGGVVDDITLYVSESGGRIIGRVVTTDGKSPLGALVQIGSQAMSFASLINVAADLQQRGVQVGPDGRFEFTDLPADVYNVIARAKGYAQGQSGPVSVGDGETVSGIEIVLGAGGVLQGYVTVNGEVQVGTVVTAVGNGVSEMTTSDRNGFYRIEGLAAGSYLASAVSVGSAGVMGLGAPLHARVELYEGQTTTHNFGEEIGASVTGYCSSTPAMGTMGYAVIRIPSAEGMSGLNLSNPAGWFSGDTTSGNYVVGMAQVDGSGRFRIENVPEGSFLLEVYYLNLGEMLGGGGRAAYQAAINVNGVDPIELDIEIGG